MAQRKYICAGPIKLDGETRKVGAPVKLDEADAQPLLRSGTLMTEADWKKRQSGEPDADLTAENEVLKARVEALGSDIEAKDKQIAELAAAADKKDAGTKDGGQGGLKV